MMIAADNLNVLHPRISEALRTLDPGPLGSFIRDCIITEGPVFSKR
jgi:hypothetical protein